ncbi:hypothetical protein [Alienimonas sp. DA493]|uniref:hypothetical protein n=1 Tax=Alienimonas sp. DA493 TaxID=3373605 RepID=UPI003754B7C6
MVKDASGENAVARGRLALSALLRKRPWLSYVLTVAIIVGASVVGFFLDRWNVQINVGGDGGSVPWQYRSQHEVLHGYYRGAVAPGDFDLEVHGPGAIVNGKPINFPARPALLLICADGTHRLIDPDFELFEEDPGPRRTGLSFKVREILSGRDSIRVRGEPKWDRFELMLEDLCGPDAAGEGWSALTDHRGG